MHQLRSAGYRIDQLRALMPGLRCGHRSEGIGAALAARDVSIAARSRALLDATVELSTVLAATQV
ncbi:hypothetical protein ACWDX6_27705 [Streptomyces sp. NPDC003027]